MQDLIEAIKSGNILLFVGAGVSASVGLPPWGSLISHIAEKLDYDPDVFNLLGDYLTLAEYYTLQTGSIGPLRSWMDVEWHKDAKENVSESAIHKLIVDLAFPIIYTTNYDGFLELAHEVYGKKAVKVANIGDLVNLNHSVTQIIKFHGDFDDDNSIVLTESSYFERMDFESPLDIKLRADVLGRVALFIGYSLSDINIRYLLYRLHKLWQDSPHATARPKSYIFLGKPNPVQERVLTNRGIIPLFSESDDPGEGLKLFLDTLYRESRGGKASGHRDIADPSSDRKPRSSGTGGSAGAGVTPATKGRRSKGGK
jgi:hypothetical protein